MTQTERADDPAAATATGALPDADAAAGAMESRRTPQGILRAGLLRGLGRQRRAKPIALHLLVLGLAASLPAIVFAGYLVLRFDQAQREATALIARSSANAIASSVDRSLEGMMITLRVLASANALRTGDLEAFHARTHAALRGSGTHFILVDESFQQLLNTRVPFGTPLPVTSNPEATTEALRTGALVVSDLFFGNVSETFVFNVVAPLEVQDGSRYALILTRNANDLQAAIDRQGLSEGWSISLTDRNGNLIAGAGSQSIGEIERFTESLANVDGGGAPAYVEREGERYLVAVENVPLSRWRVAVWAPKEVIDRPLRQSLQLLVLAGLLILGATFVMAMWYGRHIAQPIRKLARNARALGHSGRVEGFESAVSEVNEVSEALSQAARQRGAAEERIRLLMGELSHRAKNQLAVVSAMARQTAANSESLEEFAPAFNERIQALSRSTNLLGNQSWRAAGLRQLIQTQLEPFDGQELPRVDLDGPEIELNADAAQNLGLALHELATNASKYGALASEAGRVTVQWRIHDGSERRLELVWSERGGPPVSPPTRTGFGSVVIERLAAQALKAEVTSDFAPGGVTWRLDMPCDLLQPTQGLFG